MVKIGIIGADTPLAGEIIRILINHPETEIISLYAPAYLGRNISTLHHGFIGEKPLNFTDKINTEDLDFLMILRSDELSNNIISRSSEMEDIKILVLDKEFPGAYLKEDFEIGLSEINRKALVRGATKASIPSPILVPALISLVPLANYLLLNSDINIEVSLPEEISRDYNEIEESKKLKEQLKKHQASLNGTVNLKILGDVHTDRAITTKITFKNSLPEEEVEKIYDQIYDDHNFTFITRSDLSPKEVEGTQKTVIKIKKPDPDTLILESVADARLRGGAGDAVHVLNLFFGLHEKTGLSLKPSGY